MKRQQPGLVRDRSDVVHRAIRDDKRCARVAYGAISSGFVRLPRLLLPSVLQDAR